MATITPAGSSIGRLPILLIALSSAAFASADASPDEGDDLAAHAALRGLAVRDHPDGRGHDRGPEPTEDARKAILPGVHPTAGLGDALEVRDDATAIARELELDDEHLVWKGLGLVVSGLDDLVVLDVVLVVEDARDLLLHLGGRHRGRVVQRAVRVADPREHVRDRIGEHLQTSYQLDFVIPGTAPWCASSRRQIRQRPNFR